MKTKKVLERHIEQPVVRWAKKQGVIVTKLNLMGNRSWPDRCFWLPGGRPLLIEFKAPGETPTKLQNHTIALLRNLGYEVLVVDTVEDGIYGIENFIAHGI